MFVCQYVELAFITWCNVSCVVFAFHLGLYLLDSKTWEGPDNIFHHVVICETFDLKEAVFFFFSILYCTLLLFIFVVSVQKAEKKPTDDPSVLHQRNVIFVAPHRVSQWN